MVNLLLAIIYLAFIGLGLPDSLLGAAWPSIYPEFGVAVSRMGLISMIISMGTVVSSLNSDRLTRRWRAGKVTAVSVALTALALAGFSVSGSFWMLCLWAVPYGLGAGGVDAALNNYVALHFASRHMSWLHCMWGIGASLGPYAMGYALAGGGDWTGGYRIIGGIQVLLTLVLFLSLPLWKKSGEQGVEREEKPLSLGEIVHIPGAKAVMVTTFCYCSLEQTLGQWASSYLVLRQGSTPETAASYASMFFIGITAGRAAGGFLTAKFNDTQMVRLGQGICALGVGVLLLAGSEGMALTGLVLAGLGCAPIYPSVLHATPYHFGAHRSQAIIGVQMASAYVGTSLMPPLFGVLAQGMGMGLLPVYGLVLLGVMIFAHEALGKCEVFPSGTRSAADAA